VEGKQHPDRNAQFEHIAGQAKRCVERSSPSIRRRRSWWETSRTQACEWQPNDALELVDVHDFPSDALGKAIPYGVYDIADNSGFVNVGTDHDTPVFASDVNPRVVEADGQQALPRCHGTLHHRRRGWKQQLSGAVWKFELQRLADKLRLPIHLGHFPPGTSDAVNLIGNTTNSGGAVVSAWIDRRRYPTGKKVTPKQMRELKIEPHAFHGDWNCTIHRDRLRRDESRYPFEGPKWVSRISKSARETSRQHPLYQCIFARSGSSSCNGPSDRIKHCSI
jgi:Rhodopirellula transposase DDE domain